MNPTLRMNVLFAAALPLVAPAVASAAEVSFSREVAPILVKQCQSCHGQKKSKGNYRLHTFDHLLTAGSSDEKPIVAGRPLDSEFFKLLITHDADDRMPKDADPLPKEQIDLIRRWIEQGAKFDGPDTKMQLTTLVSAAAHDPAPATYALPLPVTALAVSPDGTLLATSGHNEVLLFSAADGKLLHRFGGMARQTLGLAFSPDGKILAVAGGVSGELGEVRLVHLTDGKVAPPLAVVEECVLDVDFSPDGAHLAIAAADQTVRVFEVASGKQTFRLDDHSDWVMAVRFSPDGRRLATASRDKTARLVDISTGETKRTFRTHDRQVFDVAFADDGQRLYSIGADRRLRLWSAEESAAAKDEKKKDAKASPKDVVSPPFGAEPQRMIVTEKGVLVACADGNVHLVSLDGTKIEKTYSSGNDWVYTVGFDARTGRVFGGGHGGDVRAWDAASGETRLTFPARPVK